MSDAPAWPFSHLDVVRFADLDVLGHLNNAAFLVFVESARVAYLRSLVPGRDPSSSSTFGVMVAETKIVYRSPARYDEQIETRLRPADLGRTSFRTDFEMRVGERLLADGYGVMVIFDRVLGRPAPIPPALRERFAADGAGERLTKL